MRIKGFSLTAVSFIVFIVIGFSSKTFGQSSSDVTVQARTSALKDLITSVEGQPKEPIRIFKTKDGYLRFIGAAPSTYFAIAPGTSEKVANEFIGKWRNLFVNESSAVEFQKIRVKTQNGRSYVRYRQMYSGLEVFGAEMIVQVNAGSRVVAVISDIMRDTTALDTGIVSLEPAIDTLTAQEKAVEFLAGQYGQLRFTASAPVLMIFEPLVVGDTGPTQLVW